MIQRVLPNPVHLILTLAALAGVGSAAAHQGAASELLLPYFEVDLQGQGPTTFFSVVNGSDDAAGVDVKVFTNWGIEILASSFELEGHEVRSIDLSDWVLDGQLPHRSLGADELEHCQAALSGQLAADGLYYSTAVEPGRVIGYLTMSARDESSVLFGDYFIVDPVQDYAQGEVLIDISDAAEGAECAVLCSRHGLRFLTGGGFDDGTEIVIWTGSTQLPSADPYFPSSDLTPAGVKAYKQSGEMSRQESLGFLPLQVLKVSDLSLGASFGWLELVTEKAAFMTVRYSAERRFSVGLQTSCLPSQPLTPELSQASANVSVEAATNGVDADHAPGPAVSVDAPVTWTYTVTNVGDVELFDLAVTDDHEGFICGQDVLTIGESMVCEAHGVVAEGPYATLATVVGKTADGEEVSDSDPTHCHAKPRVENPHLRIDQKVNGQDEARLTAGDAVTWTFEVHNVGNVDLADVTVTDDLTGLVCLEALLARGQRMTCEAYGTAQAGPHANAAAAVGTSPLGRTASATDSTVYHGETVEPELPRVDLETTLNGHDADSAPGVELEPGAAIEWIYTVRNTGNLPLTEITVTDDRAGLICNLESLEPGQATTCSALGVAQAGAQANVGTVTALAAGGVEVSDSDASHYVAQP